MEIRGFKPEDLKNAQLIFNKHFGRNIDFPDFLTNYLCAFTIHDDKGIITTGGVRTVAEICLITDKDRPVRQRIEALKMALDASVFVANEFRYEWLHAITDDPIWASQMKVNGFVPRGEALEFDIRTYRRI